MSMYHYHCRRCKHDFYVKEHLGFAVEKWDFSCPHGKCRSRQIDLKSYSAIDDARLLELSNQVEDLERRFDAVHPPSSNSKNNLAN